MLYLFDSVYTNVFFFHMLNNFQETLATLIKTTGRYNKFEELLDVSVHLNHLFTLVKQILRPVDELYMN